MAGATRLSLRPLGLIAALGVGIGAAKLNPSGGVKELLVGLVTGPGSMSRIVALVLVLVNLKVLPLVWHFKVLYAVFRNLKVRLFWVGGGEIPSKVLFWWFFFFSGGNIRSD